MRKQVAILVAALAALCGFVWLLAWRAPTSPAPASTPARPPPPPNAAVERLRTLQVESASRMPDDVPGVFIGLRRDELLRLRPHAREAPGGPPRHALFQEVLENGAVVAYLVATSLDRVAQVQFLSRLPDASRLVDHYGALRARYGEPTGFMDCPQNGDTSPTRRILWIGRECTVMEAVLAHPGGVSLTLAVAGNQEVAGALRAQGCRQVTRERFGDWPVATELRGERFPVRR